MTDKLQIEVLSRDEASEILTSPDASEDICFLISIGEWIDPLPQGFENITDRLRLVFADTSDPNSGASEGDVQRIIDAARELSQRGGRVLVHCQAGVSRSSAAALIVYAVALGPGREEEAMQRVIEQRPIARPNWRMVEIADQLLARSGRLMAAVANHIYGW